MRLEPTERFPAFGRHGCHRSGRCERQHMVAQRGFQPDPIKCPGIRLTGFRVEPVASLGSVQQKGRWTL